MDKTSFANKFSVSRKHENIHKQTKRVKLLKLFFPSLCAFLIGVVIAWPQISSQKDKFKISIMAPSKGDLEKLKMINAKFYGTDKRNQLYSLSSDLAEEKVAGSRIISLKNPKADILFNKGNFLAINAKEGVYHQKEEILKLIDGVDVFHDDGYDAQIDEVTFNLSTGDIYSKEDFYAKGPLAEIKSKGIKITNDKKNKRVVIFTNKVKLKLFFNEKAKKQ